MDLDWDLMGVVLNVPLSRELKGLKLAEQMMHLGLQLHWQLLGSLRAHALVLPVINQSHTVVVAGKRAQTMPEFLHGLSKTL